MQLGHCQVLIIIWRNGCTSESGAAHAETHCISIFTYLQSLCWFLWVYNWSWARKGEGSLAHRDRIILSGTCLFDILTNRYDTLQSKFPSQSIGTCPLSWCHTNSSSCSGSLPSSWSHMPAMEVLTLSGTQLSGSLPQSWANMINLTTLHLADTAISGKLPGSWGNMGNLTWVDLRGTGISPGLPGSWRSKFCKEVEDMGGRPPAFAYLPWNVSMYLHQPQYPRRPKQEGNCSWCLKASH
jgi:hypothetical protein